MATELGKAYVQIVPSAKGISGMISKELAPEANTAGDSVGESLGSNIISKVKGIIVGAGIGKFFKESLEQGGALQQSLGGVETLFKENADIVKQYAREAYKTSGVGANEYMENVTSFSAALIKSMGGNTKDAADVANTAMMDMSDNMNKMGTPMRDIQNAYQGFAKQNYTMLDNLKLGYGGTKGEMERLLKDAQELTGVEYNIDNLSDVYNAIHAIQENLGITGTTALEASETLSGSFGSMKAAFTDVLGNLALGENIQPSLEALATTVSTFLFKNFIPMVGEILSNLPGALITFIQAAIPQFISMGSSMINSIVEGFTSGAGSLSNAISTAIVSMHEFITTQLPTLLSKGVEIISNIASGIMPVSYTHLTLPTILLV